MCCYCTSCLYEWYTIYIIQLPCCGILLLLEFKYNFCFIISFVMLLRPPWTSAHIFVYVKIINSAHSLRRLNNAVAKAQFLKLLNLFCKLLIQFTSKKICQNKDTPLDQGFRACTFGQSLRNKVQNPKEQNCTWCNLQKCGKW